MFLVRNELDIYIFIKINSVLKTVALQVVKVDEKGTQCAAV
jgi:hypothetical protein